MTDSLFTSGIAFSADIAVAKHDILLLSTARYDNASRVIAHRLKDGRYDAILAAAIRMARCLPQNCVLVPAPSRKGYAVQTLKLARMISEISGVGIADVLKGNERIANYDAKRLGHPLKQADLGIRLDGELPDDKFAVVIDNVIDRGTTAFACANAIGSCAVLSYAMTGFLL